MGLTRFQNCITQLHSALQAHCAVQCAIASATHLQTVDSLWGCGAHLCCCYCCAAVAQSLCCCSPYRVTCRTDLLPPSSGGFVCPPLMRSADCPANWHYCVVVAAHYDSYVTQATAPAATYSISCFSQVSASSRPPSRKWP
jgi:hypothetical protein